MTYDRTIHALIAAELAAQTGNRPLAQHIQGALRHGSDDQIDRLCGIHDDGGIRDAYLRADAT